MVFDAASYGNRGFLVHAGNLGPTWTNGKYGSGLKFDGVDDHVTINSSASLNSVTDQGYTFGAWARPDRLPPNSTPNDASYSILVREYTGLYYDHDGRFKAVIRSADGTVAEVKSDVFEPNSWHHIVMVADEPHRKLYLYVDGREVSSSPVDYLGGLADHEDAPYYIGTSEPLTERYELRFRGKIDEPRIFDRALSQSDVAKLYAWTPSGQLYPQGYSHDVCK